MDKNIITQMVITRMLDEGKSKTGLLKKDILLIDRIKETMTCERYAGRSTPESVVSIKTNRMFSCYFLKNVEKYPFDDIEDPGEGDARYEITLIYGDGTEHTYRTGKDAGGLYDEFWFAENLKIMFQEKVVKNNMFERRRK